ncbi:hypothetical protein HOLleu_26502 [Holothuria leucospilota]|uniref:TNF family profile domain-containing protein n=1 Tax=Holothuria leucospilota TaxID=206669 RepID=A0A9Q1BNZ2_HOLLE|nr:hypothetical protein HOLleu_26502 [Holothuria leucospilota]
MDSCSKQGGSKDTLVGVKGTWEDSLPSRGSVSLSSMRWLIIIVAVLMGFVLMFFVVAWQQIQISTMQLELDSLLHNEIDQLEHSYMSEELKNTENETNEAIISRLRRQVSNSRLQNVRPVPFAHLTEIRNDPGEDNPYLWAPPSSGFSNSTNSYYSNVQLHYETKDGARLVKAIQVSCSGWFYAYAQVPYHYNDSKTLLGHKIVKLGNCGNAPPLPVLQTVVQLTNRSSGNAGLKPQNWKYLGGIVHLAAGDHVQVQAATAMPFNKSWVNSNDFERPLGGFLGLYQIQEEQYRSCRRCQ